MTYHYQKDYKGEQISFTVYEHADDVKRKIYIFYITKSAKIEEPTYIGTVRFNFRNENKHFYILEDYTLETPLNCFRDEVQYFFDIIYDLWNGR